MTGAPRTRWLHRDGSACAHRFFCWRTASPPPESPEELIERMEALFRAQASWDRAYRLGLPVRRPRP